MIIYSQDSHYMTPGAGGEPPEGVPGAGGGSAGVQSRADQLPRPQGACLCLNIYLYIYISTYLARYTHI